MNNVAVLSKAKDDGAILEHQIKETKHRLICALKSSPWEWHEATVVYALTELLHDFCVEQSETEKEYADMLSFVDDAMNEVASK